MSRHPADAELLGLIDVEIPTARAVEIEQHLKCCPACAKRHAALGGVSDELVDLRRSAAAADVSLVRDHISHALRRDLEHRRARRAPIALALTAALIFFVVRHESLLLHQSLLVERGALPVRSFTPGLAHAVSIEELCTGRPREIPAVSSALQLQVLRDYGMEDVPATEYELDYLITPELGGIADRRNLWPEPYGLRAWNAHAKDALETRLPQLICRGEIDLVTAQREIASNWIAAHKKYLAGEPAVELHAGVFEWRVPTAGPALH
jgi:hypothetical protein